MLAPEQRRALDYLRRKGTEAPVEDLRRSVADAFRKIEALFDTIPAAARAVRPRRLKSAHHLDRRPRHKTETIGAPAHDV